MNKRFGRLTAIVLSIAIILSAFPLFTFVFAATHNVGSAADFKNSVVANANDSSLVINITADFTIEDGVESDFSGTLNGNGHVITVTTGTPLFNEVKNTAKINNLGVIVANNKPITGFGYVDEQYYKQYCGAFANVISGTVSDCFSYGTITVTDDSLNESYVGGFCGSVTETASVTNSFSCVSINTTKAEYVGGFAGIIRSDKNKGTPTVKSCYSSGYINNTTSASSIGASSIDASSFGARRFVTGFANAEDGALNNETIGDTYTSCQIVKLSNDALPSGVNGLYDNQLSLMRESLDNPGLSTKALMQTTELSEVFTVTSTTYPAIKGFFDNKWSKKALDVVEVSVAAASFSDVTSGSREEPADVMTRADYLPLQTYVDRTNTKDLSWSVETAKIYDTVPVTSHNEDYSAGTGADLLRARLVFSADNSEKRLTATKNGMSRVWYISAYKANPYFSSGNGTSTSPYQIATNEHLNNVRYYSLITNASYKVTADFRVGTFDPIVDFIGTFDGDNKVLTDFTPADDREGDIGLFANTRSGSTVKNLYLANVNANTETDKKVGALIGSADTTTLNNIVVFGSNKISGTTIAGGVIGEAKNSSLKQVLISVEIDAPTVGGIVGKLVGGTLTESGSTGLVGGETASVLGGLVGETAKGKSNAAISYSYSTATVLSHVSEAVCGGLIGNLTGGTLTYSYSAALAAVKNDNGAFQRSLARPLVGSGNSAGAGCSYDGQFYDDSSNVISVSGGGSSSKWTVTTTNYPQITYFADKTDVSHELSSLSTVLFYYQHYWEDKTSDDASTGFIPSVFNEPTIATDFCAESDFNKGIYNKGIYSVESTAGYGFEPASGVSFVAVRATDPSNIAVRYATVMRDDLIPVSFSLTGSYSGPIFVSIAYSSDAVTWKETQLRVTGNEVLYDIPKNSYIRVRAWSQDESKFTSAKLFVGTSDQAIVLTESGDTGYYVSAQPSAEDAEALRIEINFQESTPPWGVQRDTVLIDSY